MRPSRNSPATKRPTAFAIVRGANLGFCNCSAALAGRSRFLSRKSPSFRNLDMLQQALDALTTYDWGTDVAVLGPIEEAVATTYGNADARKDLETKLAAILTTGASRDAKDYV